MIKTLIIFYCYASFPHNDSSYVVLNFPGKNENLNLLKPKWNWGCVSN